MGALLKGWGGEGGNIWSNKLSKITQLRNFELYLSFLFFFSVR